MALNKNSWFKSREGSFIYWKKAVTKVISSACLLESIIFIVYCSVFVLDYWFTILVKLIAYSYADLIIYCVHVTLKIYFYYYQINQRRLVQRMKAFQYCGSIILRTVFQNFDVPSGKIKYVNCRWKAVKR